MTPEIRNRVAEASANGLVHVGLNNVPLSPILSGAGFRIFRCDTDDELECCCCGEAFGNGEDVYWSDDGIYLDAAEAHCRRCAFTTTRLYAGRHDGEWCRRQCGGYRYYRAANKLFAKIQPTRPRYRAMLSASPPHALGETRT